MNQIEKISRETGLGDGRIEAALKLFDEGATIPFIARYRKEATGSLDEIELTAIRDRRAALVELEQRRVAMLKSLTERELLSPELEARLRAAGAKNELEDIYEKYRPKRRTRAQAAREKGLAPLARRLLSPDCGAPGKEARPYVKPQAPNPVATVDEALAGARDIIAEEINEDENIRAALRRLFQDRAEIESSVVKDQEGEGAKFKDYFAWREKAGKCPGHRLLAMLRGHEAGILKLKILPEEEAALKLIRGALPGKVQRGAAAAEIESALKDAWKRLLSKSLENEYSGELKDRADREAIAIFAQNLRQLLLSPPLGQKRVLAIDPGFRSGGKVVCLDAQGRLLHHNLIYLHQPEKSAVLLQKLCDKYDIEAIAIGNGTAGRETEALVNGLELKNRPPVIMVDESGASIYSASEVARREFPDHDLTVRGAVSIGRRLIDPLAELVKLDPKSIGVGQYQHDVDQKALQQALDDVVVSCVNQVGVEVNTASAELLSRVAGLTSGLAANIIARRESAGPFTSRRELLKVPRLGAKTYEQAAGFLRIRAAKNPLDNSGIHPESYAIVEKMARDQGLMVEQLLHHPAAVECIDLKSYISKDIGLPTLQDIHKELLAPGRDPRESFTVFRFADNVNSIGDLMPGMKLPGIITNITAFGAFCDIGVHQDGLIHISQLADRFVRDPTEVVALRQPVAVKVLEVDLKRKRIGLSLKEA